MLHANVEQIIATDMPRKTEIEIRDKTGFGFSNV